MFIGLSFEYWLFVGPTILLSLFAQARVKRAFAKWSRVPASSRMSGAQAAQRMLQNAGVRDVKIEPAQGFLSDHYDPRSKTLRLSSGVYRGESVAAMGIACHEAGHALQHASGYAPLSFRSAMVPAANIGSMLSWPLILGGMFLGMTGLLKIGVVAFGLMVAFQLVTLPVEFDASSRAKKQLRTLGILQSDREAGGVAAVLNAAALTYVAAAATAVMQLLYFLSMLRGRD